MITEEKKKTLDVLFRQSFRVFFDRLKPNEEFKKVFTKKMHRILGPLALTYSTDKIPTLDEAYALLGRVHAH